MKVVTNIICAVVLLGVLLYPKVESYVPSLPSWNNPVVELVKPDNTYGFDASIPAALKDKTTAHKLSGLFTGLADEIDHDASRSKPEIRYAANIRDTLREAVNIKFDGKKLNDVDNSGLGNVIGPVFEKEFPDGAAELDQASRKKAVGLFRAAAYGCALVK